MHAYFFFLLVLQLEECAIQLWNWAVTKNVGTTISKNQKAKGTLLVAVSVYMIIILMIMTLENTSEMLAHCKVVTILSHSLLPLLTVRHVACSLLFCCEPENPTEGAIRKQILVSSNTALCESAQHFRRRSLSLSNLYRWPAKQGEPGSTAKIPRWQITS